MRGIGRTADGDSTPGERSGEFAMTHIGPSKRVGKNLPTRARAFADNRTVATANQQTTARPMPDYNNRIKIGGTGTLTTYRGSFSGPTGALEGTEPNDDAKNHEIAGEILDGEEIYGFDGVPTGFEAQHPWELDLALDLGTGWVEFVPTMLNSAEVEIRSDGAHYMLSIAEPGMILRGDKADTPDQVTTLPNTVFNGNVRGGRDSVRVWPPVGLHGVADNPAEFRVEGGNWRPMAVCSPEMEV